jgi:hypothetical protein
MATSILQYPLITSETFTVNNCASSNIVSSNPVYNWILFGKIGESGYAVPSYNPVITTASSKNRLLNEVITAAIPATSMTVELAVNGILTFTVPQSVDVVSSDGAVATATILNETTTITGVAAGTSAVTISDRTGKTISTIVVTVA